MKMGKIARQKTLIVSLSWNWRQGISLSPGSTKEKLFMDDGIRDAIGSLQQGKCLLCEKTPLAHIHHIVPRHEVEATRLRTSQGYV